MWLWVRCIKSHLYHAVLSSRNAFYPFYVRFYHCTAYAVYFHWLHVCLLDVTLNINQSINQCSLTCHRPDVLCNLRKRRHNETNSLNCGLKWLGLLGAQPLWENLLTETLAQPCMYFHVVWFMLCAVVSLLGLFVFLTDCLFVNFHSLVCRGVRRILVRGVNHQCPLAAWGEQIFENLTTKWCILKYIWINMWSA